MTKYISLFIKALLPRFLFIGHGFICIWFAYLVAKNSAWWGFSACLVLIVVEGVYNVIVRKGSEFDWVCPSAFFYSIVLLTTLISLRRDMVDCIKSGVLDNECHVVAEPTGDKVTQFVLKLNMPMRALIIEQTGILMLIIGRWTLPKGSISRNQFSQILLIYIATAADIIEFSEIYGEEEVRTLPKSQIVQIFNEVMRVWGWSILQFSLTIALPEEGLKQEEEDDDSANDKWRQSKRVAPISYLHYKAMLTKGWNAEAQQVNGKEGAVQWRGKYEMNENGKGNKDQTPDENQIEDDSRCCIGRGEFKECIAKHLELITCLVPVLMQDGPFFGYRMVLLIQHKVITPMIILLTVKNALVIICQIYRIVVLYCFEPKEAETDVNDPSVRVRAALKATHGISKRSLSTFKGSAAIQAISRMQVQNNHHKSDPTPA